jgi:hypothetical protein
MDIMDRRVLRLLGIGAVAMAIPQLALASDSGNGATLKLAMGPTSAAQKNQSLSTTSGDTVANCSLTEGTCDKPHQRHKTKRAASAVQST